MSSEVNNSVACVYSSGLFGQPGHDSLNQVGHDPPSQVRDGELPDRIAVQPQQLGVIKDRVGPGSPIQRKGVQQFIERKKLLFRARAPAAEREVVDHSFREIALLAELANVGGAGTLADLGAIRVQQQANLSIRRF